MLILGITLNAWLLLCYSIIALGLIGFFSAYIARKDAKYAFEYRLRKIIARAKLETIA